ncbi:hypothetical protein [Actinomadura alba]|uniref:hypothetical protein n=1 Tax=Actinomadura alba TaxID=406431 RepID=UPI0031D21C3C
MERRNSWTDWLQRASDGELDEFAAELTQELPVDDPMIIEVRYWLRRMRDAARDGHGPDSTRPA